MAHLIMTTTCENCGEQATGIAFDHATEKHDICKSCADAFGDLDYYAADELFGKRFSAAYQRNAGVGA
jgi:hypothetical protein